MPGRIRGRAAFGGHLPHRLLPEPFECRLGERPQRAHAEQQVVERKEFQKRMQGDRGAGVRIFDQRLLLEMAGDERDHEAGRVKKGRRQRQAVFRGDRKIGQNAEDHDQRADRPPGQVNPQQQVKLVAPGDVAPQDKPGVMSRNPAPAPPPAHLLAQEAVDGFGQFRQQPKVIQIDHPPAGKRGADRDLHILDLAHAIPAACLGQRGGAPDACGAVKDHRAARTGARGLFEHLVGIQLVRLQPSEQRFAFVHIVPPGLHRTDARIGEEVNRLAQEIRRDDEIGIEYRHVFAGGALGAVKQRPGLEPVPVAAPKILECDIGIFLAQLFDSGLADFRSCFVIGIVQILDLELVSGIIQRCSKAQALLGQRAFVVDRKLHRHPWQIGIRKQGGRLGIGPALGAIGQDQRDIVQRHRQQEDNCDRHDNHEKNFKKNHQYTPWPQKIEKTAESIFSTNPFNINRIDPGLPKKCGCGAGRKRLPYS